MTQINDPDISEDIPAWLLSFNRRMLRLFNKPGHYTLSIVVGNDPSDSWTYSISEQLYYIRNVKIRLEEKE